MLLRTIMDESRVLDNERAVFTHDLSIYRRGMPDTGVRSEANWTSNHPMRTLLLMLLCRTASNITRQLS